MIKTIEKEGSSIEEAISIAVSELGVDRDAVSIEIIEKGKSGFFGFGSVKAKVKISYEAIEEKVSVASDAKSNDAVAFIDTLLEKMNIEGKATLVSLDDEFMNINIEAKQMGAVIGRRGDTLDAIQYITSLVVNKNKDKHIKINLDIENYREKRKESLERLAINMSSKALKYKKNMTLEPMSPYERRIIHAKLQEVKGITTYSTGNEPNRRVVISCAKKKD